MTGNIAHHKEGPGSFTSLRPEQQAHPDIPAAPVRVRTAAAAPERSKGPLAAAADSADTQGVLALVVVQAERHIGLALVVALAELHIGSDPVAVQAEMHIELVFAVVPAELRIVLALHIGPGPAGGEPVGLRHLPGVPGGASAGGASTPGRCRKQLKSRGETQRYG
jgi:hypothetical protein